MAQKFYGLKDNSMELDRSKCQQMRDIFEIMKSSRKMYQDKKAILRAMSEYLIEDNLDIVLKEKVENLLASLEVEDCMLLDTKGSTQKLLGLEELCGDSLSFKERETMQNVVHNKLRSLDSSSLDDTTQQITEELDLFNLNIHDKTLLELKSQLHEVQATYMENLKHAYGLLMELAHMRLHNVRDVTENKIEEYKMKTRMYDLRSDLIKEKTKVDIFNETSISFVAYEKLVDEILQQQNECQKEINELIELKEKYKNVTCQEYNEILKSYLQYKASLERKQMLYKQLENK